MAGKVCVVTGANSGIGKAAATGLARMGATVVLACRHPERGNTAKAEIEAGTGNRALAVMSLDLARFASVRAFAREFADAYPRLDVLVNNAGIYTSRRRLTEDGHETTWQVDYLSHFLLTNLLLDALRRSAPSRVVSVSSGAHTMGTIRFEDLDFAGRWSGVRAYAQAKLAQILFTQELARRVAGTGVAATVLHPGAVRTNWSKGGRAMRIGAGLAWPFMRTPEKGADTVVWLASAPVPDGWSGRYFKDRAPVEPKAVPDAPGVARRLWEVSEALARLRPPAGTPS